MLLSILFFSPLSHATLTPTYPRGEALVEHLVPGRASEICLIPKRLAGFTYNKSDSKHEASLCAMNVGQTIAACAKSNSSNPGVDFFEPPAGTSLGDFTAGNCSAKGGKKEAKYKISSS
jgi:hypothetical protein